MSIEPSELLDRVGQAERLAEAVEAHLDDHPLPVDEAEVERIAARLHARMERTRPTGRPLWPMLAATALGLAAVGLIWVQRPTSTPATPGELPAVVLRAEAPPPADVVEVAGPPVPPEAAVAVQPGSRVLVSSERRETVVVLVQEGGATLAGTPVPAAHFGVQTRTDAGAVVLRFRDGERPPEALDQGVWAETAVHEQLEELRWRALPDATLSTLDTLLEAP